jgi:hypothetical protein
MHHTAPKKVQGPQEDHDAGWRTTHSHTPKQMMSVYRELFFAGLPKPALRGAHRRHTDDDDDDDVVAKDSSGPVVTFPPALVKEMFARFGPITSFDFDVVRGVGAVTYEHGEDAERCFITAHLSLMRGGSAPGSSSSSRVEEIDGDSSCSRSAASALADVFGKHAAVLYVEFAQWLPFVNPLLLDGAVSALTTMNRQLLRTFPVCERRWSPSTAHHVVFNCKAGPVEKNGSSISLPGHGTMSDLSLAVALVHTLLPSGLTKESKVTVLDLWAQFYEQFVVSKTQPDLTRIAFPEFRFAAKASSLQDVMQHCKRAMERGDAEGRMLLARFAEDDVLHSTMAYIVFKTRMMHDPSHISLLRAVDSKYAKLTIASLGEGAPDTSAPVRSSSCFVGPSSRLGLEALVSQPPKAQATAITNSKAPATPAEQWLILSLVTAATNVITNASFMYPAATGATLSSDEEEEARFDRVLKLFDEFASSGSVSTMIALCCAPEIFCGPSGLPATLPTMQGMLWRTFRIPLVIVGVLGVLMVVLLWWPTTLPSRDFDY